MIHVVKAPPYLAVQDAGRVGFRRMGVPLAGAMDQWALASGNALVGNPSGAAGLEWALGGGAIRFDSACDVAITGAKVDATIGSATLVQDEAVRARPGDMLDIRRIVRGRFAYVTVGGGITVDAVLGSRSTYLPAAFGGFNGRLLRTGDIVPHGDATQVARSASPRFLETIHDYDDTIVRAISNPLAPPELRDQFFDRAYVVSVASDRTGYRMEGAPIDTGRFDGILSVATCPGAIQLPPSGLPIVLLADAPTVGGYLVLAVVCDVDLPIIAQRSPGDRLRFETIDVEEAQSLARVRAARLT